MGGAVEAGSTTRPAADVIDRVLALVRFELGMDVAYLGRFAPAGFEPRFVDGDGGPFGIYRDEVVPLGRTLCARMASGLMPNVVRDTFAEPATSTLEFTHRLGIRSYAGVAIRMPDNRPIATIGCLSAEPRLRLSTRSLDLLNLLARHVGDELGRRARVARAAKAGYAAPDEVADQTPAILRGITSELSGSSLGGRLVDMPLYQVSALLSGRRFNRPPEPAQRRAERAAPAATLL